MIAYDSADPDRKTTARVLVSITRNPTGPKFKTDPYEVSISQEHPLGDLVANTTAIDFDGVNIT